MKSLRLFRMDNWGVSALEYAVIVPLIILAISPALYKTGQSVWGGSGGAGTKANLSLTRGPYSYPDGSVFAVDKFTSSWLQGNSSYSSYGITAINGNLFFGMAAYDPVKMVSGPLHQVPFVEGQVGIVYVAETGGTVFLAASLVGGVPPPPNPTFAFMNQYPSSKTVWSCGC